MNHPSLTAIVRDNRAVQVAFDPAKWVNDYDFERELVIDTDYSKEPQLRIALAFAKRTVGK